MASDALPSHSVLADALRAQVYSGELEPGERLSTVEMAREHGAPLSTVKDAFRLLIDEGVLISKARVTYVRTQRATTVTALLRLLTEAGELLEGLERRGRPEVRMAVRAWRGRARAAGADV